MMPAGRYYVGDLCYVMHPQWSEVHSLLFPTGNDNKKEGAFQLKNGVRFASFFTLYGDGVYEDQTDGVYPVDSGSIGCIRVEDIAYGDADLDFGNVVDFEEDFEVSSYKGILYFGDIWIDTSLEEELDDDEE